MNLQKQIFRPLFFLFLLLCLLSGLVGIVRVPVNAAPLAQIATNVVISEFRTRGPSSADDEFIEIYNATGSIVNLLNWQIKKSTGCGAVTVTPLVTIGNINLLPGQYYLIGRTPDYTGSVDQTYSSSVADDGGIALLDNLGNIVDQVGMCSTTTYREGTTLAPLSGTANQSYERLNNGCTDTGNNATDFIWNQTTSNPQNSSAIPIPCLRVINVSSPTLNGTYTVGAPTIPINVKFSNIVDVTGLPRLLLETGATDRPVDYSSGSGTDTLTFNYTIQPNDTSGDLDYVATNSLSLNGGAIVGAAGNANLILPSLGTTCPPTPPATPCSLGANNDIRIDNGDGLAPSTISFIRQPSSSLPTNADSLIFRVTFSEAVIGVDANDFVVTGITGTPTLSVLLISSGIYDVTVSGGNLNNLDGVVGLDLSVTPDITDVVSTPLPTVEPSIDESYTVDNSPPTVTVNQAALPQTDPTNTLPVNFTVVFSEPINVSSFTVADITLSGTATSITWNIINSGDNQNFTISATAVAPNGTVIPSIAASRVTDLAGNSNTASASTDNVVTFTDIIAPTVTINQAAPPQIDPTNTLPIRFTVVFSEAIIASIFTPADITQGGTATGITWSIVNSGDSKTFTLSATAVTGAGTLQPSIAANRVTDLAGNNNLPSTSTDNTVVYETVRPTVTVNQAVGQADPTNTRPVRFTVVFSEPINVSTFTTADITLSGTAVVSAWSITNTDAGVNRTFTLSATALTRNGTIIPSIAINTVTDLAGNNNFPSTSIDNTVTYTGVFSTPTRTPTATPTATPTLGIIISEVAWMGTVASSNDEWVELYNGGSTPVDLSGWTLKSTDGVINITFLATDSDHIIESGTFFILAQTGDFSDVVINKNITATFDNNGKSLQLRDNSIPSILIDTANSNGGSWPAGISSPTYATMERHAGTVLDKATNWYTFAGTPTKHDRNGNLIKGTPGYANWAFSVTATLSPTPTNTIAPTKFKTSTPAPRPLPPPPPRIAINEFVPRPGHDWNSDGVIDVGDEYIELINFGVAAVNLSGYSLDDEANIGSSPYRLPSVILKPGERMVFYGKETGLLLSDGGDGVRLLKPNGQLADAYNYSVVKYPDQAYCRMPDNGGDLDDFIQNCFPTPGLKNSLSGSFVRPPTQKGDDPPECPIADILPIDFAWAECPSFGNIWSRFYWDAKGWFGEKALPDINSKWDVYVD